MSLWRYTCRRAPCRTASLAPSMMDAWFSASEKMWQPLTPASAAIVPALAAKPVGNSRAASLPAYGHFERNEQAGSLSDQVRPGSIPPGRTLHTMHTW